MTDAGKLQNQDGKSRLIRFDMNLEQVVSKTRSAEKVSKKMKEIVLISNYIDKVYNQTFNNEKK